MLVDWLNSFAEKRTVTASQIALAWLLAQKHWIVPIPGTTRLSRVEENNGAVDIQLTPEDLGEINQALASFQIVGDRYPEEVERQTNV